MKRKFAMLCGSLVAAGLGLGAVAYGHEGHDKKPGADDKPVTITGELIDTACFVTSDGDAKGKEHAACAKKCMASGVPATTSHTTSRAPFIVASSGAWRCIKSMGSIAI